MLSVVLTLKRLVTGFVIIFSTVVVMLTPASSSTQYVTSRRFQSTARMDFNTFRIPLTSKFRWF